MLKTTYVVALKQQAENDVVSGMSFQCDNSESDRSEVVDVWILRVGWVKGFTISYSSVAAASCSQEIEEMWSPGHNVLTTDPMSETCSWRCDFFVSY